MEKSNYIELMNKSMRGMFREALGISLKDPSQALFILRTALRQKKLARIRREMGSLGIQVPPYLIASITGRCNLRCKGCYAMAKNREHQEELSMQRLDELMGEASAIGISVFMIAGGEPLVRSEIIDRAGDHPDLVFPLFTNGTLLDDAALDNIKDKKNIVPVISMEGYEEDTDNRRGEGVYDTIVALTGKLKGKRIFFGTSITVTRSNFDTVTGERFISGLVSSGCKLLFYVEYVPFKEGTENWVLTDEQRIRLAGAMESARKRFRALFIAFPGDEKEYGGCLSSGRGFVHISPGGDLEPCPFAPYSDSNLKNTSLKEALRSRFLATLRENRELLSETEGSCALWENREFVQSILLNK